MPLRDAAAHSQAHRMVLMPRPPPQISIYGACHSRHCKYKGLKNRNAGTHINKLGETTHSPTARRLPTTVSGQAGHIPADLGCGSPSHQTRALGSNGGRQWHPPRWKFTFSASARVLDRGTCLPQGGAEPPKEVSAGRLSQRPGSGCKPQQGVCRLLPWLRFRWLLR